MIPTTLLTALHYVSLAAAVAVLLLPAGSVSSLLSRSERCH